MNDSEAGPSTWAMEDFDVFLNHRGPDTKATFVAHLYPALKFEGFQPFFDRHSLEVGSHNQESIYRALNMAKVHVAVVSKRYAESQYCLNELVAMMNSGKPMIPVFYDVEPDDLLDVENGKFAEAFENHKKRQTSQEKLKELKEWTDALASLSKIVGFPFNTTCRDRDEAKLVQEVVKVVAREFPRGSSFVDENRRVGLEKSRKEVVQKLESGRVGVVGLYGMGGIGKTTLAEGVYGYCAQDFRHRSFLRDVRSSDALTLQNQIIKDLRLGKEVNSREEYRGMFHKFNNLKVLIVVDDIDNRGQFEDIIPDLGQIGKSSRVIVTSRDRGLLSNVLISTPQLDIAETEKSVLYEVEGLNSMDSQLLFNYRAFLSKSPDKGFEDLAVKVAVACSGHPLALEVAGGFLRNKKNLEIDRVYWDEMAKKATRHEKVQSILRTSYEKGLDDCQKIMFLDISCHLIGESSVVALEIWASCESCVCGIQPGVHSSLHELTEKCLVKLDTNKRLQMHDVLRDMGRQLVEVAFGVGSLTRWDRTHWWNPELADAVLRHEKGSDKVRGFSRVRQDRVGDTSIPTYDAAAFSKMSELHLLVLDGCRVSGDFSKWSKELRLLRWRFFPLSELPSELNLAKIAVVDLCGSTKLERLWKDETHVRKACLNLRWLILNYCIALTALSQDVGKRLPKLKVLDLGSCVMLESLPNSIGEMKDLEQLILHGCQNLRSIPDTIRRLKKLKHLDLSHCSNLEILPDAIVNLVNLEKLLVVACDKLQNLPMDFRKLKNLKVLQLHSDKDLRMALYIGGLRMLQMLHLRLGKLKTLPDDLGQLTGLTEMCLDGCTELASLPDVGTLRLLKTLNLGDCRRLKSLPESLGTLAALTTLKLKRNVLITELPESFKGLISLVHLEMKSCLELQTVKALPPNLRHLDLGNCQKLDHLPSFEGLISLATLILCNCARLGEMQGLNCLTTLEEVNLTGCKSMRPGTLQLQHIRAMRSCCLSGSNVAVKYDSDWSEREPALQLITYYDYAFGFVDDGLVQRISSVEHCHKVCMEATVVSENECVSIVICCVAHDQGWSSFEWENGHYSSECFLDAWIVREGQEFFRSPLITLKHADCRDQVYLCTLRRTHPLVRFLKHGDKIRVAARSDHPRWAITVTRGAICVVHGLGEEQVISVDSRLLDVQQSREKRAELAGLILADNPECPAGQIVDSAPSVPVLEPGAFHIVPKYFLHEFDRYWELPSPGQGVLSFVARAVDDVEVNNVSICLSPQTRPVVPRYEICLANGICWIRRHVWHDSDSNQSGIIRPFRFDNPLGRNPFWVSIDKEKRELRVGRGEPDEDVILEYEDLDFFSDVQYISFSTYGSPVIYSDVRVSAFQ